jgi:SH3 domain protein
MSVCHGPASRNTHGSGFVRSVGLTLVLGWLALAGAAHAEQAWVKDELRLNVRTGPGTQYRILGAIGTGDKMEILKQTEGWTRVRIKDIGDGWIPAGFLQPEPPAGVQLAQHKAETVEFRSKVDSLTTRTGELEARNASLEERDGTQRAEIESLTRENLELRAGARWPEWITGAGILIAGMVMGAVLQSIAGRRQRPRIRL